MNRNKKSELTRIHKQFFNAGIGNRIPQPLALFVDENVYGFGTAVDEKVSGLSEFKKLLNNQKKQSKGIEIRWKINPLNRFISDDENNAVFSDELNLSVVTGGEHIRKCFRFSVVLNYSNNHWKVIHWHGSAPEQIESDKDTFDINEWKQKTIELEKIVAERTLELSEKNLHLKIEAALERVRDVAMGMKTPSDMLAVCKNISEQLTALGVKDIRNVQTAIIYENKGTYLNYEFYTKHNKTFVTEVSYQSHRLQKLFANRMLKCSGKLFTRRLNEKDVKEWYKYQKTTNQFADKFLEKANSLSYYWYSLGSVALGISTYKPLHEYEINLFKRFLKVFELTYKRFLDIEQAEAQAYEARIETALEKVRAVALSLTKSDEMLDVAQALYEQLLLLGFTEIRNAIIDIHDDETETFMDYDYSKEMSGTVTRMSYYDDTFIEEQVRKIESSHDAFFELLLEGKQLQNLIDLRIKNGEKPDERLLKTDQLTYNLYSFGNGAIGISNFGKLNDEQKKILERFRVVFTFAYKRYSDMAQAEAQAREAKIEAALEKVRSRTLAMQNSNELAETSAVLFQQLIHLGIEPNRLYICIIKDKNGEAEFWITDEDGSKVNMAYEENLNNNATFKNMFDGWQSGMKSRVIDMHDEELQEYFRYLNSIHVPFKGGLSQKRRIQYITYFSNGMVGMASPDEQPAETLQLLERFAFVFNLTYARFNDLKVAEAHAVQAEQDLIEIKLARRKAEEALTELQATQKQLIQSEKMASLGELTAGIAHEIQNPLNFVNNFSEVSNELMDEMNEELDRGAFEGAKVIAGNIKSNLEKINHHGKRADAIVKGMLQHSRTSSGQKEPTDINLLADEYLRLAYHGLRAKDKSFNAKFETDFDNSIEKINVVPQDIGRVILNLINNAFYAVTERKKMNENGYEPTVIVSTKRVDNKILISVKDNGTGIPQNIVDKIFQPFFTTKPTGSGTGLGLSLSYDIVKTHGGEIKVETKENEGTKVLIILPFG